LSRDEMQLSTIDLGAAVTEALSELEPQIQERNADVQVSPSLPSVSAHAATLVRILSNLISNGLKFVPAGTHPRLRISAEVRQSATRLWIEDNGIGIRAEHHEQIFGLFQRLHSGEEFPGTGIGLAIVRKGVERMGGCAGVESTPGDGSRFWIELPTAPRT